MTTPRTFRRGWRLLAVAAVGFTPGPLPAGPLQAGAEDADRGLVLHLPLNGNARDASGHHADGEIVGGVRFVPGVHGRAASFDGRTAYLRIPQTPALRDLEIATISYWIKYHDPTGHPPAPVSAVVGNGGDDPALDGFWSWTTKEGINHYVGRWCNAAFVTARMDGARPLAEQPFVLMTFVIDREKIRVFRDAEFIEEADRGGRPIGRPGVDWYVGQSGRPGSPYFLEGVIDDLRIYNRPLGAAEIEELFAHNRPRMVQAREETPWA